MIGWSVTLRFIHMYIFVIINIIFIFIITPYGSTAYKYNQKSLKCVHRVDGCAQAEIAVNSLVIVERWHYAGVVCYKLFRRILAAHNSVCSLSPTEAKMSYIKAWQSLPHHGITYFIVRFKGLKKEVCISNSSHSFCFCMARNDYDGNFNQFIERLWLLLID